MGNAWPRSKMRTVAILGGSISLPTPNLYASLLEREHRVLNYAVPATPSSIISYCVESTVRERDVDLFLIEFAMNDLHSQRFNGDGAMDNGKRTSAGAAMARLLRRIALAWPAASVALLFLHEAALHVYDGHHLYGATRIHVMVNKTFDGIHPTMDEHRRIAQAVRARMQHLPFPALRVPRVEAEPRWVCVNASEMRSAAVRGFALRSRPRRFWDPERVAWVSNRTGDALEYGFPRADRVNLVFLCSYWDVGRADVQVGDAWRAVSLRWNMSSSQQCLFSTAVSASRVRVRVAQPSVSLHMVMYTPARAREARRD